MRPSLSRTRSAPAALAGLASKTRDKQAEASTSQPVPAGLLRSHSAPAAAEIGAADKAKQGEHPEPLTFTGTLRFEAGKMTSDSEAIRNLIGYLGETADPFAHQSTLDGTQITIKPNPRASSAYDTLKERCQIDEVFVRPEGSKAGSSAETAFESKEIEANVLVPLLSAVIEGGRDALGPHAALRDPASELSVPIHDFLASLCPHILADDPELQVALNQKVRENKDLSAKLGAETMLQIATQKQFSVKGLLASLGVSAGLGATWELWGSHVIKHAAFGKSFSPSRFGLQLAGVDSVPPLIIETMDTVVVLAIIKTMKGDHDWSLKGLLPKALTAGAISAAGSFPNNILQYKNTGSRSLDAAAGILTTEAAILSAASGIPLEVTESRNNTKAAIVQTIADGLFALPPLGTGEPLYADKRAAQIEDRVNTMASQAIALSPGDGIGQKSMAFAAIVGLIPLLLSNKVTNLLGEPVLRIMRSTVFNPIEAIALNFLVLSSRINIPHVMRSDYQKHAHTVARLFAEASAQSRPVNSGDLQRILDPNREVLRHLGNRIVAGMSGLFDLLPALGRSAGIGETPLAQRIPYERLAQGLV